MGTIKENVLKEIQVNKGITLTDLHTTLDEEKKRSVNEVLNELINEGLITDYRGQYYPIVRHIDAYSKENEKLVEEVELTGLTATELVKVIQPYQDDSLFFDGYELNANNAEYFINRYGVDFKFNQYDYYLEASFDNKK
ncbi:hypothetical protein OB13_20480 [Pontibacter sp. HJ8]